MRLSSIFSSYAPCIMFRTSFQSSKHTGELVLWKLRREICTSITQIQKFPKLIKSGQHDFKCFIESLKVSHMCMICRVCAFRTNRKTFQYLWTDRSSFPLNFFAVRDRYCSNYTCFISELSVFCFPKSTHRWRVGLIRIVWTVVTLVGFRIYTSSIYVNIQTVLFCLYIRRPGCEKHL